MSEAEPDYIDKIRIHMMLHGSQHRFPLENCCALVSIAATETYWRSVIASETASQVQEMKNAWVEEVAKNVQEYFASGEAIDNCANEKELDNWRYIREIVEFIREMKNGK